MVEYVMSSAKVNLHFFFLLESYWTVDHDIQCVNFLANVLSRR